MYSLQTLRSVSSEAELVDLLLSSMNLKNWSYCREWHVHSGLSQYGVGDLLFFNDQGDYLVMEVKWFSHSTGRTARTSRRKKRLHVVEQARWYAAAIWQTRSPRSVLAYVFTNDPQDPGLRPVWIHQGIPGMAGMPMLCHGGKAAGLAFLLLSVT
jgi:hypothetical protein